MAAEGVSALVDWEFESRGYDKCGYDKIVASTMAVNHASRRVMEKRGMRHVRTVHADWPDPIPGSEEGEVWYEVTRVEWHAVLPSNP